MNWRAKKVWLLDMDGTLLRSNRAHALSWYEAFRKEGFQIPLKEIESKIGMGADNLIPALIPLDPNSLIAKRLAKSRAKIFATKYFPTLKLYPYAKKLLQFLKSRNVTIILASSAEKKELKKVLKKFGLTKLVDCMTSSADAARSKPYPDILLAALTKSNSQKRQALMLGDTPYDVEAARRAGISVIALSQSNWSAKNLAAANLIFPSLKALYSQTIRQRS